MTRKLGWLVRDAEDVARRKQLTNVAIRGLWPAEAVEDQPATSSKVLRVGCLPLIVHYKKVVARRSTRLSDDDGRGCSSFL